MGDQNFKEEFLKFLLKLKDLGLIITGDGFEYIKTEAFYLLYLNWGKKYGERALFNKQNFGRKIISYNISNQTKKYKGKTIRAYQLDILDNIINGGKEE